MKRILIIVLVVALMILGCAAKPNVPKTQTTTPNVETTENKPNVTEKPSNVVQTTPKPTQSIPETTIVPTVIKTENKETDVIKTENNTVNAPVTLKSLPNLIANDISAYRQVIKKVTQNKEENAIVCDEKGEKIDGFSVYKYNDESLIISKDRKGYLSEYNETAKRKEITKVLLENVDVYGAQIYFEAGFSLRYTADTIEIWQLGEMKQLVRTPWAKHLENFKSDHVGFCLDDSKFPYYVKAGDNKIFFFRFYSYKDVAMLEELIEIEAEYYANYKNNVFYKQGSCVYMFNGFETKQVASNVKSMSHNKKTIEPIISLENGQKIYGAELLTNS